MNDRHTARPEGMPPRDAARRLETPLPPRPPASPDHPDLDAEIAAAEWRVIERDARVLRHGAQLGERLSSRSTQARLLLAGVAGVAAVVALSRLARRAPAQPAAPEARGATRGAAPPPAQPAWLQWLPLALQLVTASSRPAAPPPPAGLMGWVGPLLAAGRGWAGLRRGGAGRAAAAGTPAASPSRRGPGPR
jgi:hypothetical protein